jgi:hypothetical protein
MKQRMRCLNYKSMTSILKLFSVEEADCYFDKEEMNYIEYLLKYENTIDKEYKHIIK